MLILFQYFNITVAEILSKISDLLKNSLKNHFCLFKISQHDKLFFMNMSIIWLVYKIGLKGPFSVDIKQFFVKTEPPPPRQLWSAFHKPRPPSWC